MCYHLISECVVCHRYTNCHPEHCAQYPGSIQVNGKQYSKCNQQDSLDGWPIVGPYLLQRAFINLADGSRVRMHEFRVIKALCSDCDTANPDYKDEESELSVLEQTGHMHGLDFGTGEYTEGGRTMPVSNSKSVFSVCQYLLTQSLAKVHQDREAKGLTWVHFLPKDLKEWKAGQEGRNARKVVHRHQETWTPKKFFYTDRRYLAWLSSDQSSVDSASDRSSVESASDHSSIDSASDHSPEPTGPEPFNELMDYFRQPRHAAEANVSVCVFVCPAAASQLSPMGVSRRFDMPLPASQPVPQQQMGMVFPRSHPAPLHRTALQNAMAASGSAIAPILIDDHPASVIADENAMAAFGNPTAPIFVDEGVAPVLPEENAMPTILPATFDPDVPTQSIEFDRIMAGIQSNDRIAPFLREENAINTTLPVEHIEHATMMPGVQFTDADFPFDLGDGIAPNLLNENAIPTTFPTTLDPDVYIPSIEEFVDWSGGSATPATQPASEASSEDGQYMEPERMSKWDLEEMFSRQDVREKFPRFG